MSSSTHPGNTATPGDSKLFAVVVPTLGRSPWLRDCLEALRSDGGDRLEIVVVCQGGARPNLPPDLVDQTIYRSENLGFAGGTNLGLAACRSPYVATVNDDAIVRPGWFDQLLRVLETHPKAAAAQGLNLLGTDSDTPRDSVIDGRGMTWNRAWQAIQIDHGLPFDASKQTSDAVEVFGVSATAALFRAEALALVALQSGEIADPPARVFDPELGSYYEDADLACRLRAAGYDAFSVPSATALHAGSTTGRSLGLRRQRWIYGNRYLVASRWLGPRLWGQLPRMIGRDLLDLGRAVITLRLATALGILAGWGRAARRLRAFRHRGSYSIRENESDRFLTDS